jgi:hypothetical protein
MGWGMKYLSTISYEWWVVACAVIITAIGFFRIRRRASERLTRLSLANDFRHRFILFANSRGQDTAAYQWMLSKSTRLQNEMGHAGLYAQFREPFNGGIHYDYAIILNMVPKVRELLADNRSNLLGGNSMYADMINSYVHAVDDALLRYIGQLQDADDQKAESYLNPIHCFRVGMEQIMALPLHLLSAFGLLGARTLSAITGAAIFKFAARLAALVAFVGSIMGMLVDGPQLVPLLEAWSPEWLLRLLRSF